MWACYSRVAVLSRSLTRAVFSAVLLLGIVAGAVRSPSIPSGSHHTGFNGIRSAPDRSLPASIAAVELPPRRPLSACLAADHHSDGDLGPLRGPRCLGLYCLGHAGRRSLR